MTTSNNNKLIEIEGRIVKIEVLLNEALTNHIPHLQAQIDEFRSFYFENHKELTNKVDAFSNKIAYWTGGGAAAMLITNFLLKIWK